VPYGIIKVTTARNDLLYEHKPDDMRVLVAPGVAAEMTDLLQTAVNTGTARAAQIGRPVAGKTGTTSSNKDGWFLGFSSGITTGVWMGRDDARAVPGLQGGHAPAKAFADFMRVAVASRPVEPFETEVTLPEWQLEPDDEAYGTPPEDEGAMVDENGNPIGTSPPPPPRSGPERPYPEPEAESGDAPTARPRDDLGALLDDVLGRSRREEAESQESRPNQ
jgi:penicillin-binding protein 1A